MDGGWGAPFEALAAAGVVAAAPGTGAAADDVASVEVEAGAGAVVGVPLEADVGAAVAVAVGAAAGAAAGAGLAAAALAPGLVAPLLLDLPKNLERRFAALDILAIRVGIGSVSLLRRQ